MDHCSKTLTAHSQALAEKAEESGTLFLLDGELYCECGARVGAHRRPQMDGPNGGRLWPTLHYPKKISRKPENPYDKSGYYKR
jgi:hypothetical protein